MLNITYNDGSKLANSYLTSFILATEMQKIGLRFEIVRLVKHLQFETVQRHVFVKFGIKTKKHIREIQEFTH